MNLMCCAGSAWRRLHSTDSLLAKILQGPQQDGNLQGRLTLFCPWARLGQSFCAGTPPETCHSCCQRQVSRCPVQRSWCPICHSACSGISADTRTPLRTPALNQPHLMLASCALSPSLFTHRVQKLPLQDKNLPPHMPSYMPSEALSASFYNCNLD